MKKMGEDETFESEVVGVEWSGGNSPKETPSPSDRKENGSRSGRERIAFDHPEP